MKKYTIKKVLKTRVDSSFFFGGGGIEWSKGRENIKDADYDN